LDCVIRAISWSDASDREKVRDSFGGYRIRNEQRTKNGLMYVHVTLIPTCIRFLRGYIKNGKSNRAVSNIICLARLEIPTYVPTYGYRGQYLMGQLFCIH
jgi:hypothetical protein